MNEVGGIADGAVADFDVRIEPFGQGFKLSMYGYPEGDRQAILRPPFPWSDLEAGTEGSWSAGPKAARHLRPLRGAEPVKPKRFGTALFQGVFVRDLPSFLQQSLERAERDGRRLRLRLQLGKAAKLGRLPWEYLFDPHRGRFLAQELSIVRHLEGSGAAKPLLAPVPLQLLVVHANPPSSPALAGREEERLLRRALGPRVDFLRAATLQGLTEQLRRKTYTALHFIGHGAFRERAAEGALLFEGAAGGERPVDAHHFATLLAGRGIRLVVLNACEGGRHAPGDPWSGVAQELLRQGIPAVVAMQAEITDQAALRFAERFYGAFAADPSIDDALLEARKAHYVERGDGEWGTPVFYTTARARRLFSPSNLYDRLMALAIRHPWRVRLPLAAALLLAAVVGAWANRSPWPPSPECPSPPGFGLRFRKIEPGSMTLGGSKKGDAPLHEARIERPYCMGQFEVTWRQWRQVRPGNPDPQPTAEDDKPVTRVSWNQVTDFLAALNRLDGKAQYRLPTEEEWEYAARAGSLSALRFDAAHAHCGGKGAVDVLPVGSLQPNSFGLFDMSGNVREWVEDAYLVTDGTPGALPGEKRLIRGGGFKSRAEKCGLAARDWLEPSLSAPDLGFRIVRNPL